MLSGVLLLKSIIPKHYIQYLTRIIHGGFSELKQPNLLPGNMPGTSPNTAMDKVQFEQLFRMYFERLCAFARQYVSDRDTAQDICQKVFIRLWEKREEMDPERSIASYLFTSVKNRCLNHIRDHKKYRSRVLDVTCGDLEIGMAITEDHFAVEELQQRIDAALNTLPPKCRKVFEMSRYEQKKYKEIALELDISQKTVEAHMSKAIRSLRDQLGDYLTLLLLLNML